VLAAGLLLIVVLTMYFYDHARRDLIAPGVRVEWIPVGGLHANAARARLERALGAIDARGVVVRDGSLRFRLTGRAAHVTADVNAAVAAAVRASRGGWIVGRTLRGLFGGHVNQAIPVHVSYDRAAVAALVGRVRAQLDRAARDATVTVTGSGLDTVQSRDGITVRSGLLARSIGQALVSPTASRLLDVPLRIVKPAVTTGMLTARYPAYIIINRPAFTLRYYAHLRLARSYPIAVGQQGLETPAGLHHILDKQVDPAWHVPNSPWAGSLAGQVIPPGPGDPLVARWMAIDDLGDGIHGTDEPGSIGSAASHGCIRMLVPDVIALYSITPLGTPVYVI
jgi:lipoprotein-anchoring transpeptidase ErfK/SrfK